MTAHSGAGAATSCGVDVVIPVYNGERYILRCLESVLNQDLLPAAIIVVDDGSTDATATLVQEFRSPVPITYLRKENGGPNSARNAGLRLCSGEYVAFLDADDEWYPHKLSRQMELFRNGGLENLGAVYCRYHVIDEESRTSTRHFIVEPDPKNRGYIFARLLEANLISGSASGILVRRECFQRVGLFDESLRGSEDWDMWLRIAERYQFDYVADQLVRIRRHGENKQKDAALMFANALSFYNKWSSAARRHGHHFTWCRVIICRILADLPALGSLRLARETLTRQAKEDLFRGVCWPLLRHLLRNAPRIAAAAARRLLGREELT